VAADLLRRVLAKLPYKVYTVLPDNGGRSPRKRLRSCPVGTALPASATLTAWRIA
jgi:hypothetical protein